MIRPFDHFPRWRTSLVSVTLLLIVAAAFCLAQPPGIGGPGGPGGPGAPEIELVDEFDADGDGILNTAERKQARAALAKLGTGRRRGGPGRRGPGGGRGPRGRGGQVQGRPGPVVEPDEVEKFADQDLYDPSVLRTIFLQLENEDWEQELADFKPTDVEVPATMIVDGKTYPNIGVSFRGASSFFMIPPGSKRSLNLSVDFIDDKQRLYGYKTLNLLNCNGDASLMSTFLYQDIAGKNIAAPKANFVNVVINGRSWGVYANVQQFNKDFLKENYNSEQGARWKVKGSPRGDGGLRYLGDDPAPYRERFEIKSKDHQDAWNDLIDLCRILDETPVEQLESTLKPILDIDGVLWFLAVDLALINSDGYWTRASDYSIYQDKQGIFHILPHDMNEAFRGARGRGAGRRGGPGGRVPPGEGPPPGFGPPPPGGESEPRRRDRPGNPNRERGDAEGPPGPGGRGGPGGGGFELDPLVGLDDPRFPLRSKLLANENLKHRYLQFVRTIAEQYLDWEYLGSRVAAARGLIADEVKADTRKLMSNDAFERAVDDSHGSLREFSEKRRTFLLDFPAIKKIETE